MSTTDVPPSGIGYYTWRAVLVDGTVINQYTPANIEISVDVAREWGVPVRFILLLPRMEGFPLVALEVVDGAEWVKKWIRTITVTTEGDGALRQEEQPVVDCVGIKPPGGEWVYTYIYADGSIKTTSNPEP